jgi:hypothetical protein
MASSDSDPLLKELIAIKKLLVLDLLSRGLTQAQVASALDMDRTGVGRMFPTGALASLARKGGGLNE